MFFSLVLSIFLLNLILNTEIFIEYEFSNWLRFGQGSVKFSFWFDIIASLMFFVVLLISFLVHVYSCFYMGLDPFFRKFLVYLTLFTFFMLFLVASSNLLQMYFGWEGVGICSYLLINFWYTRLQANKSSFKAILVNRIGDCGFLFAIALIFLEFGSLDFQEIFSIFLRFEKSAISNLYLFGFYFNSLDVISFLLFLGVMSKSAQLGLHTWLPDAMEGPTPVSALIHAATMVTAGIFLMIRTIPFFEYSQSVLLFASILGGLTAFFAATVALAQYDLKKIIAYSTCSQLGYMVVACSQLNPFLGLFHLANHAFFKALLFLGAGVIIHCFSGDQDIRKMGGLRQMYPLTFVSMFIASMSLAGFPFFSGYYSKDLIINFCMVSGSNIGNMLWLLCILSALCTSIYSASLVYFIFLGRPRFSLNSPFNSHKSNIYIIIPLVTLSVLSIISGYIFREVLVGFSFDGFSDLLFSFNVLDLFFFDSIEYVYFFFKFLVFFVGLFGFMYYFYVDFFGLTIFNSLYFKNWYSFFCFFSNRWYWDAIYRHYIIWPIFIISIRYILIDSERGVMGISLFKRFIFLFSFFVSLIHNGFISWYLKWIVFSYIVLADVILFINNFI